MLVEHAAKLLRAAAVAPEYRAPEADLKTLLDPSVDPQTLAA
jgi:hypothetical protein